MGRLMHQKGIIWVSAAFLASAFWGLGATADAQGGLTVSGSISGCSGRHPVHIMLWDEGIFKGQKPLQKVIRPAKDVKAGKVAFRFKAKPGRYTISSFEDEDANGSLKMGLFGPREPAGFYREFKAWRKPKFEDVGFQLSVDIRNANIRLK